MTNGSDHTHDNKVTKEDQVEDFLYRTKRRLTIDEVKNTEVTYNSYIETDKLLSLQGSVMKSGLHHHDEHLFIVCHQSFELWFKQILFELTSVRDVLARLISDDKETAIVERDLVMECMQACVHRVKRADQIMRYCLGTFDLLETMHPADFLEFRDYIGPASGFQSVQMREMELLMGLKDSQRVTCSFNHYTDPLKHHQSGLECISQRQAQPSIKDIVYRWLDSKIAPRVPSEFIDIFMEKKIENLQFQKSIWIADPNDIQKAVDKELTQVYPFLSGENSEEIQALKKNNQECQHAQEHIKKRREAILFIYCFRQEPELYQYANLLDDLVAFEEGLLLWRTRHLRMVERMIGRRTGTGGSSGVDYLESTTSYRVFLDLWQAKSHFIRSTALPRMYLNDDIAPTNGVAQE